MNIKLHPSRPGAALRILGFYGTLILSACQLPFHASNIPAQVQLRALEGSPPRICLQNGPGAERPLQFWLEGTIAWPLDPDGSIQIRSKNPALLHPLEVPAGSTLPPFLPLAPRLPLRNHPYREQLDLFVELVEPWSGRLVHRWEELPVEIALPGEGAGADYDGRTRAAIERWNAWAGRTLLRVAEENEEARIRIKLQPAGPVGSARWLSREEDGRPHAILIEIRDHWTTEREWWLDRVLSHELGHALGLWGHQPRLGPLMSGVAVSTAEASAAEARSVRWLYSLPPHFDLGWWRPLLVDPGPVPNSTCPFPVEEPATGSEELAR